MHFECRLHLVENGWQHGAGVFCKVLGVTQAAGVVGVLQRLLLIADKKSGLARCEHDSPINSRDAAVGRPVGVGISRKNPEHRNRDEANDSPPHCTVGGVTQLHPAHQII